MKTQVALVASLLLYSVTLFAADNQQRWRGYVTDTHCGTNCQVTPNMKPDKRCIKMCIRKGSKYGLWSGNHVYVLEPQSRAAKFAARDVDVSGKLDRDTIHVVSIRTLPESTLK